MQSNLPSSSTGSSASFDSARSTVGGFKKPPKNIVITKDTLNDIKLVKKRTNQTITQNKKDQQRVELDVILSGFLSKPNADEAVKSIVELLKLTMKDVKFHHHFENRVNSLHGSCRVYHHIAITLKDKSLKLKLLKAKAEMKGEIRLSMILSKPATRASEDPIITCLPSLSKFNYSVQKQLTRLQSHGIINYYEFGDTFHRLKVNPQSAWKEVSYLGILDEFNEVLGMRNKMMSLKVCDA